MTDKFLSPHFMGWIVRVTACHFWSQDSQNLKSKPNLIQAKGDLILRASYW